MVWGCFTSEGIGYLCRIDGGLDAKLYKKILKDELMQTINYYGLDKNSILFQHDNDPKHTAKSVKKWLEYKRLAVLDWPSQSPDLNPIEHIWNEVERRLRDLRGHINSKEDLWEKLQDVWNGIEVDVCRKLIATMPQRIQDVLKAKGGYTR